MRSESEQRTPGPDSEWFRTLAEVAQFAVFVYLDGRLLYTNPASTDLTGYSRDELLAMSPDQLIHPEHVPLLAGAMSQEGDARPIDEPLELALVHRDGDLRWLALTTAPIRFHGQQAWLGTAVDITRRKEAELGLQESRERLELAHKAGSSVAWEWHPETDRMMFSAFAPEVIGIEVGELPTTAAEFLSHVPDEDRDRIAEQFRHVFKTGDPYSIEHRLVLPDGEVMWLHVRGHAIPDPVTGRVNRVVGVSADISERRRAERALREEKELAQVTLSSIGDGVVRTDVEGRIDFVNPAAESLLGAGRHELVGRPVKDVYRVVAEDGAEPRSDPVELCLAAGQVVASGATGRLQRSDGGEMAVRDTAAPVRRSDGSLAGAVLVIRDVTRLRELEREMAYLASHDPLTGLINRREFDRRLRETITSDRGRTARHALCYLDLDDFKVVNDTCGHIAGDELLRQLTAVLATAIRPQDTLARLGGDEFGILLRDTSTAEARRLTERFLASINHYRFVWEQRMFQVGASVGIVPVAEAGGNLSELMSAADAACYVAKDRGRNQIHVSRPDDAEMASRYNEMNWVQRIRSAREDGRFRLFGQPIVPLADPTSHPMVEILLRMVDEHGNLVSPSHFLAAAERYRLMPSLDRWVVEEAIRSIAALGSGGAGERLFSINLSGQSLTDPTLSDHILDQLRLRHVEAGCVVFEITETAAVSNLTHARRFMTRLRGAGCRFILDDFGSGLSSFSYLRTLDVDYLKIDGGLVHGIADAPVQREMVAAIHSVGHAMRLSTIAERVESAEELEVLRRIGVDLVQGNYVQAPSPISGGGMRRGH